MRTALHLATYLALLFLASAVLSPPLYWLGQHLLTHGWAPFLEGFRYPAYFGRTLQVLALLTFWPFLRHVGIQRRSDLGLQPNPRGWRDLAVGLSFGAAGLGLLAAAVALAGLSLPRAALPWHEVPAILLAVVLVPVIEETLFRGALLGLLRRTLSSGAALVFVSALYAALHFINWKAGTPRGMPVEWHSGLDLLGQMLWPFSDPRLVLGGWCALFVAGLVLGDCVLRTGSLHLAIGLHAGWVLGLRTFEEFFTRPVAGLWIGGRLTRGVAPILLVLATWVLLRAWMRRHGIPSRVDGGSRPGGES